jgi:hypothetical protein
MKRMRKCNDEIYQLAKNQVYERLAVILSESVSQSTKGVGFYCYFFSESH